MINFQRHTKDDMDMISGMNYEILDERHPDKIRVSWEWPKNARYTAAVIFIIEGQRHFLERYLYQKMEHGVLPRHEIIFRQNESKCALVLPLETTMIYIFPAFFRDEDNFLCVELQAHNNMLAVTPHHCKIKFRKYSIRIPFTPWWMCLLKVRCDLYENLPPELLSIRVTDIYGTVYPIVPQVFNRFFPMLLLLKKYERVELIVPPNLKNIASIE